MKQPIKIANRKRRKKHQKRSAFLRSAGFFIKWSVVASIWCALVLGVAVIFFAHDLPSIDTALSEFRKPVITLLAANGKKIAKIGEVRGTIVQYKDLPVYLPQAIIATEDRRYFDHLGIDLVGIARAAIANIRAGRIIQGGSTLTQQAAKNLFLSPERTLKRKVQEILLALWLERNFTKHQIFTIYLNRVYLGAGTYGVEAASKKYFGKSATSINLYQSALIAGLLKAPSRLNPLINLKGATKRAQQVLTNMVSAGYLKEGRVLTAKNPRFDLVRADESKRYGQYFIDWVVERLPSYVGPSAGDITVKTTLDTHIQIIAEKKLEGILARYGESLKVSEGAFLVLAPNGAIRALVGGRSYAKSQFNRATQARRQPGSAFKPFVYLAGLEVGLSPDKILSDKPLKYGKWEPKNYNEKYFGTLTLSEALAVSSNSIAVQVAERAGVNKTISVARRLGVSSPMRADLSIALGSSEVTLLDLTTCYVPFANGGKGVWAHGIKEINDSEGNLLYRRRGSGVGQVVAEKHVRQMNKMLSGVITRGTGKKARINRPAAGKTGTSQEFRDAWFVGYTGNLIAGVWLGNDNRSPMKRVSGGSLPAGLWKSVMMEAHEGLPRHPLLGFSDQYHSIAPRNSRENASFWGRILHNFTGR